LMKARAGSGCRIDLEEVVKILVNQIIPRGERVVRARSCFARGIRRCIPRRHFFGLTV